MRTICGVRVFTVISALTMNSWASFSSKETNPTDQLARATNSFALHLHQTLADRSGGGNVFFSPLSISTALAMTSLGAQGDTATQMKKVLRFNAVEESRLHSSFAEFNAAIFGGTNAKYTLKKANRLFGHKDFDLQHDFLSDVEKFYDSNVASLDFVKDSEGARQFINSWVGRETEQKIRDLLSPGSISEMTQLVLVNAIYFKADWMNKFDKGKTYDQDFHAPGGEIIQVPMMHRKAKFNFGEDTSLRCKILELPYISKELSMVVFLPEEVDGLERLEKHLNIERLENLLNILSSVTVEVALPRFKLEETVIMNDALSTMGMKDLFLPDKADLSGITKTNNLFVSSVIHKAFLEVNEEGSEAAAATGVVMSKRSIDLHQEFIAGHPFLFFITEVKTRAILFMGSLRKPENISPNHEEL